MKLLRKIIEGIDNQDSFLKMPQMFSYLLSNDLVDGYDDISSIENWNHCAYLSGRDYRFVRKEMLNIALAKTSGYTNLAAINTNEINALARRIALPINMCAQILGSEFGKYKTEWIEESTKSRRARWEAVKTEVVFSSLSEANAKNALAEIIHSSLLHLYYSGIEGTIEDGGITGLFDYLDSRVGTIYEGSGLRNKPYVPVSGTMNDLCDHIMDIIKNGNYEAN